MRRAKQRRLYILLACGLGLGTAAALTLAAFSSSLTYFLSPRQVLLKHPAPGLSFRLGGIVQAGSVVTRVEGGTPRTSFRVTDGQASVLVSYTGLLPDLFREGQGVVAIGAMAPDGAGFAAQEVLAKHGDSYMPKDVEQALKSAGKWNPAYGPPPQAASWNTLTVKTPSS